MTSKKGFTTKSLHAEFPKEDAYNALHMPVYDGVAYEFGSAEKIRDAFEGKHFAHAYSRTSNPTVEFFEKKLCGLTGAHGVVALASGMAAISNALLALVEKGGNIVASNQLFGHSYALLKETLPSWGIDVRFVDMGNMDEVGSRMDSNTRVLFFETITNPQLEVVDVSQLCKLAHSKGVVVVADSTITPPYVFNSAQLGVDVEVMSSTKFMSGGAAAVGGVIIDNGLYDWGHLPALSCWAEKFGKNAFLTRVRKEIFRHLGGCMTAHAAHFFNLGLDILALRVDRCVENCLALGEFFENHPKVISVNYPGLPSNKYYTLSSSQFSGKPGAVMTIDLDTKDKCFEFLNHLEIVRRATNLNDNKTLIIHPESTIYCEFGDDEKKSMKIRDTMLRISVGIEDAGDLIDDFNQALSKI